MQSRAKMLGHAVHPILIVFPLGLLATAVIFDIIRLVTDRDSFALSAGHMIGAGLVGGAVAAVFGLVDWMAIPAGTRAKRIGALHGAGNAVVVLLFLVSFLLRLNSTEPWQPNALALMCSFVGFAIAGMTGWLGGELVERLGVSVDDGANVDASSSLSRAPARATRSAGRA
jgi:uncharacterized membrane protein